MYSSFAALSFLLEFVCTVSVYCSGYHFSVKRHGYRGMGNMMVSQDSVSKWIDQIEISFTYHSKWSENLYLDTRQ